MRQIESLDNNIDQTLMRLYMMDPCAYCRELMVYSDIAEPQVIGDVLAPLSRIVNVTGKNCEMVCVKYDIFPRFHYLSVTLKSFDCLEIVIRNHLGELMPFERGRSYVKHHFRQKYLS